MNHERNAEIIRLWNLEISSKDIAARLSITKNIVIGVVTRERESGSGRITRIKVPGPYQNMRNGKRAHRKRSEEKKVRVIAMPKLFLAEPEQEKRQTKIVGISLLDLDVNGCRFPTSRVEDQHYFCGTPRRDPRTSYCDEHHQVVWVRSRHVGPAHSSTERRPFSFRKLA